VFAPPAAASSSAVAASSARPTDAALPAATLPDDVQAKMLVAGSTPICTVSGKLLLGAHALKSAPGGSTAATVHGEQQPDARVVVLADGHLFAEVSLKGVTARGYLDENPLRLGKPKTFGGVWTRQATPVVHVTGTSGQTVHATLEPKVTNVEVIGGADTIDLQCNELTTDARPRSDDPPKGKRTAFINAKTKLELSDTERGKATVRVTADDSYGFPVEVLEEHAGRARVAFQQADDRFVGWVSSNVLKAVKTLSAKDAAKLAKELDSLGIGTYGVTTSQPGGRGFPEGPGNVVVATCDLRLLANVDGDLMQVGTIAHGTRIRLGSASNLVQSVVMEVVDIAGGAKVPARDNLGCSAATPATP
jgi:hypothetical protein